VALYGVDALIQAKRTDLEYNLVGVMDEETIRYTHTHTWKTGRGIRYDAYPDRLRCVSKATPSPTLPHTGFQPCSL
jgi:hypothetical protein